jgi:hypothetical protein
MRIARVRGGFLYRIIKFCLWVGFWSGALGAHPLDLGFLTARVEQDTLFATFDLNPEIIRVISPGKNLSALELGKLTFEKMPLVAEGSVCSWGDFVIVPTDLSLRLSGAAHCRSTISHLQWTFDFLKTPGLPRTFQIMVKVDSSGAEHLYHADLHSPVVSFDLRSAPNFVGFVLMGVAHIGALPSEWWNAAGFHFPDGIDHILFLCGLMLAGGGLWSMVKTATGFTLGHSLTLALASLNIVHFPSRWIESAIALSIAYVAAEDLLVKEVRHRWWLATGFGLVHGFGFANALSELHLNRASMLQALVGFNVGVELGQIIIISGLGSLIVFFSRKLFFRRVCVPACALAIFFAGSYWFVQRAFG